MAAEDPETLLSEQINKLAIDTDEDLVKKVKENTLHLSCENEDLDMVISAVKEVCEHENPIRSFHKRAEKSVFITFNEHEDVIKLLNQGKIVLNNEKEILLGKATDEDLETVFVQSAQFWIADVHVEDRLSEFGKVLKIEQAGGQLYPGPYVYNRKVTMKMKKLVPNILKFGEMPGWCYVYYPGVIPMCGTCMTEGHPIDRCPSMMCVNCFKSGHRSQNCLQRCIRCKNASHTPQDCPEWAKWITGVGEAEYNEAEAISNEKLEAVSNDEEKTKPNEEQETEFNEGVQTEPNEEQETEFNEGVQTEPNEEQGTESNEEAGMGYNEEPN